VCSSDLRLFYIRPHYTVAIDNNRLAATVGLWTGSDAKKHTGAIRLPLRDF
jgi:hypothetical protein